MTIKHRAAALAACSMLASGLVVGVGVGSASAATGDHIGGSPGKQCPDKHGRYPGGLCKLRTKKSTYDDGDRVRVRSSYVFTPGEVVRVYVDKYFVGTTTGDAEGKISYTFTLPPQLRDGSERPVTQHRIVAFGAQGDEVATTIIVNPRQPPNSSRNVALTAGFAGSGVGGGLAALALGTTVVAMRRRTDGSVV